MRLERQVEVKHALGTSADRRDNARVTAKVYLCRAFIVAVFLPAAMFGVSAFFRTSLDDEVRSTVRRYALEAYPQWAQHEHETSCPESIETLSPIVGIERAVDPWGTPLEMYCGPAMRISVRSAGRDRKFDTNDDITSLD